MPDYATSPSAGRLLTLSDPRQKLLQRLLRGQAGVHIQRRPAGQMVVPPSAGQRRLWFLTEIEPLSPVYQISDAQPIDGELDPDLIERGLVQVVRRHEALRTTFTVIDGEPMQVVHEAPRLEWRVIDLFGLAHAEREARTREIGAAEARKPFDLAKGPLIRGTLLRLSAARQVLLLSLHHIVADGWSVGVLWRELGVLIGGQPTNLPEPIQYPDYALWERDQLTPERRALEIAYWTAQLAGLPRLSLPTDRPRHATPSSRGARVFFPIADHEVRALERLAHDRNATLFMALLAVFKVLLGRCSGQEDIAVGSPVAGRTLPETERLVGFLLNTLCLRTRLHGDPSFAEVLARVRDTALGAFAHQDLPFDLVVAAAAPERRFTKSALFNVMFVLQAAQQRRDASGPPAGDPGEWELESGTSKCDLTLSILERRDGLVGALEYATDILSGEAAGLLVRRFMHLVRAVIAAPHDPISRFDLLLDDEKATLPRWSKGTPVPVTKNACVQDAVAERARIAPDAVAVVCDEVTLGYGELDAQSNRLARWLIARGVRREDRVAVRMGRTPGLLVAVLGIWKAGAAYVPLDPDGPVARNDHIAADAGVREVLGPELPWEEMARQPPSAPAVESRHSNLAYIIYTSGSTGAPKGVMVDHGGLVSYLMWVNRELMAGAPCVMPATTKPSFDASLKQLFAPLLEGRFVWLIQDSVVADPEALLAVLPRHGDFALNCVPWLWRVLLERLERGGQPASRHLKRLFVGGEDLTQGLVERTFAHLPQADLWNLYGPTEVTANATASRLAPGQAVSIGRPIGNATALILDRHGRLAPIGVPGELHVGGAGVARGYWRRPELTAERFVPNPFGQGRLYRTGDLARWTASGAIEFIGRLDDQVKIRGFRVELGEVESTLERHPAIRQAAATLIGGGTQLAACVELHPGQAASSTSLRRFLCATLPDHMVPVRFVVVDAVPRGPHGKIDREALNSIAEHAAAQEATRPLTPDEQRVTRIWSAVLGVDSFHAESNFFEAGGHSLLLMQVVSRLREAFGVDVPLRALFEAPTVEGCADAVRRARAQPGHAPPPIRRLDRNSQHRSTPR